MTGGRGVSCDARLDPVRKPRERSGDASPAALGLGPNVELPSQPPEPLLFQGGEQ